MNKETENLFGESVAIIKGDETVKDTQLIAGIALQGYHTITKGVHIFKTGEQVNEVRNKCDSIIFLGGRKLPFDLLEKLQKDKETPIVQVDFSGDRCILDDARKFQTRDIENIARMDLLVAESSKPYVGGDGEHFWIRNLSKNGSELALNIAIRIARLMETKSFVIKDKTHDS